MDYPIKILIADAQYLTRKGLKHLISKNKNLKVVGESNNSGSLIRSAIKLKPDLVMMDYNQPADFDLMDIANLKDQLPNANILVISSDNSKENINKALEMGVNSFLTKQCGKEEITNAILSCSKGEKFFCNKVLDIILEKHFTPEEDECKPTGLSVREIEIVKLVAEGMSSKEIADKLSLSLHTIYTHRKNVMKKLQFKSSSELVLYAVNTGIVNTQSLPKIR